MRLYGRWLLQHGVRELPMTSTAFDKRYALVTPLKFDVDAKGIRNDRPTTGSIEKTVSVNGFLQYSVVHWAFPGLCHW